jgi:large subunit ribosomal protein L3
MSEEASQASESTESSADETLKAGAKVSPALNEVFGFKKGMTAIYDEKGRRIAVTVLECKPWTVTALKTQEKHGYEAVQIGFGVKKQKNAYKSELGESKKAKLDNAFKIKKEVRGSVPENCTLGAKVSLAQFPKGAKVQVTAKAFLEL